MSLFGDGDAPPGSRADDDGDSSDGSLSTATDSAPAVSTIPARLSTDSRPHRQRLGPDQDLYNDSASQSSSESSPDRGNRFDGPTHHWERWTEVPRRIAQALEQKRNQDLAVHLYNAHALRRRLYSSSDPTFGKTTVGSKHRWIEKSAADGSEAAFIPNNRWTAWPMEPWDVPRPDQVATEKVGSDEHASAELEQVLCALFLKKAHKQWQRREWDEEKEHGDEEEDDQPLPVKNDGKMNNLESAAPSSSEPPKPTKPEIKPGKSSLKSRPDNDTDTLDENASNPVFLADDDRARALLHPLVRSVLSKLDNLLTALHHNVENRVVGGGGSRSQSEAEETDYASSRTRSRGRSRSRSRARSVNTAGGLSDDANPSVPRGRGRPRKYPTPLPGETHYKMRKRVDAERKAAAEKVEAALKQSDTEAEGANKPSSRRPSTATRTSPVSDTDVTMKTRSGSSSRASSASSHRLNMNPRDWSELLGVAMLAGWDEAAIERTLKRCTDLFGEGVTTRTLFEAGDEVRTTYAPQPVDAFSSSSSDEPVPEDEVETDASSSDTDSEMDASESSNSQAQGKGKEAEPTDTPLLPSLPPSADLTTQRCPIQACRHFNRLYQRPSLFRQHLLQSHGIRISIADMARDAGAGADAVEGAVHVDGFLRPVPPLEQEARADREDGGEGDTADHGRRAGSSSPRLERGRSVKVEKGREPGF